MDDLINRQAAIDAVEFGITYAKAINRSTGEVKELFKEGNKVLNEAVERIKDLPSAQPLRMKGRWIDVTKTGGAELWKCSECGELELEDSYFCPNCGADMRGE